MIEKLKIETFDFGSGDDIQTIERDGKFWFVTNDIGRYFQIPNYTTIAKKALDSDEMGVATKFFPVGGVQRVLTVDESGLYTLIMRSPKAEARRFRKWVTSKVLPSLRVPCSLAEFLYKGDTHVEEV